MSFLKSSKFELFQKKSSNCLSFFKSSKFELFQKKLKRFELFEKLKVWTVSNKSSNFLSFFNTLNMFNYFQKSQSSKNSIEQYALVVTTTRSSVIAVKLRLGLLHDGNDVEAHTRSQHHHYYNSLITSSLTALALLKDPYVCTAIRACAGVYKTKNIRKAY